MKKQSKTSTKLLALGRETVKKLNEKDLENVNGGGSCLPPPKPAS